MTQGASAEIGVIGGSGFYELDELTGAERLQLSTPFGEPSSPITVGTLHGRRVAFISRHDEGHRLLPGELPSHANIYALKLLGVRRVLAVSAVALVTAPERVPSATRRRLAALLEPHWGPTP